MKQERIAKSFNHLSYEEPPSSRHKLAIR